MENLKNELKWTQKTLLMNNNKSIPMIGIGTSGIKQQSEMDEVISAAYNSGYRMIDSAIVYNNEHLIGNALKKLNIPRSEMFIITKIPSNDLNIDNLSDSSGINSAIAILVEKSLFNFQTDYLDLVLLHWPGFKDAEERINVYKALENIHDSGKVLSIGVSNFLPLHIKTILDNCKIKPAVNQIELHPLFIDNETIEFCRKENIKIQAYSGFAKFNEKLIKSPILESISEKYDKKPTQVLMRWFMQNNFITIPKSSKEERIKENVNIDDFSLEENEIHLLNDLNCNFKVISKWDPRTIKY